jgi:hypothetical protein
MIKRDEILKASSCLNKAEIDEPIFVLRANDPLAPAIILNWADLYLSTKGPNISEAQKKKHKEAIDCARKMIVWKHQHVRYSKPLTEKGE